MRRTLGFLPSFLCVLALCSLAAAVTYAKGHQIAMLGVEGPNPFTRSMPLYATSGQKRPIAATPQDF